MNIHFDVFKLAVRPWRLQGVLDANQQSNPVAEIWCRVALARFDAGKKLAIGAIVVDTCTVAANTVGESPTTSALMVLAGTVLTAAMGEQYLQGVAALAHAQEAAQTLPPAQA